MTKSEPTLTNIRTRNELHQKRTGALPFADEQNALYIF